MRRLWIVVALLALGYTLLPTMPASASYGALAWDKDTGKYGAIISRVLQLAAGATVLILGTFLVVMFRMGSTSVALRQQKLKGTRPTTNG